MRKYLFKNKFFFICTVIISILSSTINVGMAYVFKFILDIISNGDVNKFPVIVFTFLGYLVVMSAIRVFEGIVKANYIKKSMSCLKQDLFSKILKKDIVDFNEVNSGKYISILSNDMTMIENDYFNSIFEIIKVIWGFLLATVSMFILSKEITIVVILFGVLSLFMPKLFSKKISNSKMKYSDSLERFTIKIKDVFLGFDVIKSFNVEEKMLNEYSAWNDDVNMKKFKFSIWKSIIEGLSIFISMGIFGAVIVIGSYFTIKGYITVSTMLACVQLCNNVANPIGNILEILNNIKSLKNISKKIMTIINATDDTTVYKEKDIFEDKIQIENLTFSYNGNKNVLKNINYTFEKGKKYAIVGESGCGKSTLIKILLKYYKGYSGRIIFDNETINNISTESLYKLESMIHQNVFIFDSTLEGNISLFKDYNKEKVNEAIKISGLENVVNKIDGGLKGTVGENGKVLSGGEKQRLAIARAILKETPIIYLDEATSALDSLTSYDIEKTILSMEEKTAIVITHKFNEEILRMYDEIIVLKQGEIEETGDFEQLISKHGYFYNMYNIGRVV